MKGFLASMNFSSIFWRIASVSRIAHSTRKIVRRCGGSLVAVIAGCVVFQCGSAEVETGWEQFVKIDEPG